jgi:hypothetical protein
MKSLYRVPLLAFAVLVISSPAQAQDKAAVCQSNVEQLQKVVDRMDVQGGRKKMKLRARYATPKLREISASTTSAFRSRPMR